MKVKTLALAAGLMVVAAAVAPLTADGTDCFFNGKYYKVGDSFPKGDCCNTCGCVEGGMVVCTQVYCPCPWDLDGDGAVNVIDLLLLIGSFGPCEGCPKDCDGDGFVGVVELLMLIGDFGPCPDSPCVWDVNGDGFVDNADLQQVLDCFGPCDGCPEDVNGDGIVNGQDAAAVATHFGPCP
jgi:hypothetical protein